MGEAGTKREVRGGEGASHSYVREGSSIEGDHFQIEDRGNVERNQVAKHMLIVLNNITPSFQSKKAQKITKIHIVISYLSELHDSALSIPLLLEKLAGTALVVVWENDIEEIRRLKGHELVQILLIAPETINQAELTLRENSSLLTVPVIFDMRIDRSLHLASEHVADYFHLRMIM